MSDIRRRRKRSACAKGEAAASTGEAAAHGGFGGFNHGGFGGFDHGGFRHEGFRDFHHGFDHRFAFGGFGYFPGYYDDYADYDGCLRRVWGPGGWRLVNVCY